MLYLFAVSLVHMTTLCVLYGECRYIVMIKIYLCFPICSKNVMGIGSCETLTMEKLIAGSIICLKHLNFHGECFFFLKSRDTEVRKATRNKLFASNEKLIHNHTIMLGILHSYISVVCTYHCRGVFKKYLLAWLLFLLIFVAKKAT